MKAEDLTIGDYHQSFTTGGEGREGDSVELNKEGDDDCNISFVNLGRSVLQVGRVKKKVDRKRKAMSDRNGIDDGPVEGSKVKRTTSCSQCTQMGHNKRSCPAPLA